MVEDGPKYKDMKNEEFNSKVICWAWTGIFLIIIILGIMENFPI